MKPVIITMTAFFKNGTNLQESLKVDSEYEFKKITKIKDLISTNYKEPENSHLSVNFFQCSGFNTRVLHFCSSRNESPSWNPSICPR